MLSILFSKAQVIDSDFRVGYLLNILQLDPAAKIFVGVVDAAPGHLLGAGSIL